MAEKVTADNDGDGAPKKGRKVTKTHNQADLAKKLEPFIKDINKAYDAMEEDHGSHVLSINHKFTAIAEKIGHPATAIRSQVAKIRRGIKAEKQLKEAELEELEAEAELLEGFAGTAFGRFVQEKLDKVRSAISEKARE